MSDDGAHALVVIAMLGNVFSPRYARARKADPLADPLAFSTMNVALYGRRGSAWALTERGRDAVHNSADAIAIGPSSLAWDRDELVVRLDERSTLLGRSIAGTIRVRPIVRTDDVVSLDRDGLHRWRPLSPVASVHVDIGSPFQQWTGRGYVDANDGDVPLERSFDEWTWWRAPLSGNRVAIGYRAELVGGGTVDVSRSIDARGRSRAMPKANWRPMPRTSWGIARALPGEAYDTGRTLENTPFYARTLVGASVAGESTTLVHEAVSLRRFRTRWVQGLLPFRMRREASR